MFSDPDTLSAALWVEILQHVPQQQRLSQCAVVCRAWAPAAAQATVHVECQLHANALPAFQSWLAVHAGQLRSLKLSHCSGTPPMLRLPLGKLTQLQHLKLQRFKLRLTGGECRLRSNVGNCGDAARPALASLLHLELCYVELAGVSSLLQLTKAPQLNRLLLPGIYFAEFRGRAGNQRNREAIAQRLAEAMPGLLQQLPQLSVLQVEDIPLTEAARQQIANLQRLQSVSFTQWSPGAAFDVQLLPSSITRLHLYGLGGFKDCPMLPPELPHLPGLLQLDLSNCSMPPGVLGSVTQLQVLSLEHCKLLPVAPGADGDAAGAAALLDVLPKLQHLQELKLEVKGLKGTTIAPQRFSGLTASSHLTKLVLKHTEQVALPKGAAQHMFPASKQMQSLQFVEISTELESLRHETDTDKWCLDSADISGIASCCPNLQWFDITCSVHPDADMSVLLQLPGSCTALHVGGVAFTDAAAPVVAQLTQLQQLGWCWSPRFTIAGLEQLVDLNLQKLSVFDTDVSSIPIANEWQTKNPRDVRPQAGPKVGVCV